MCKKNGQRCRGWTGQERHHNLQTHSLGISAASNKTHLDCVFGLASSLYGFSAGGFTPRLVSSLRTMVVAALWSTKRRSRCREIVLTLFVKGHLVDTLQNAAYQSPKGWVGTGKHPRWTFTREGRPHLGLLDGPESLWLHEIRQGLRLAEWRKVGKRRNDMRGIESMAGIDKLAATKAMNSTKIHPEQRNDLRELLCGCVWTQKRQFGCHKKQ